MNRPLIAALLLTTSLGLAACGDKKDQPAATAAASPARAVTWPRATTTSTTYGRSPGLIAEPPAAAGPRGGRPATTPG